MSDLRSQLLEFAAKRAVSELVRITAKNLENKAKEEIRNRRVRNALNPNSKSINGRKSNMARNDTAGFTEASTRGQAAAATAAANADKAKEPVEFWVNTCIVSEDGEEPIRILTGRPLKTFKANREVTTSNDEFNKVNVLNNAFVHMLNEDAAKLNLGESIYYSPQGTPMTKEGEPKFKKGIYLQLRREETDHAAAAAEKIDLEAQATTQLRKLFGN
jgi:hypothetical protein